MKTSIYRFRGLKKQKESHRLGYVFSKLYLAGKEYDKRSFSNFKKLFLNFNLYLCETWSGLQINTKQGQ